MNKRILFILVSCFLISVFAEENAEHATAPTEAVGSDQKATKELMDLEKQIATTNAKVTAKEAAVKELIKQKQTEKDPEKLTEIIKMLQQEHRELGALIKEQTAQMGVLQYRFPERGVSLQRKYKRFDSRSLEDMEKSVGLEGHLNKSREKVNRVYGYKEDKKKKTVQSPDESVQQKESILEPTTLSK